MKITLNSQLEQLVQAQLNTGNYDHPEQVIGAALQLLESAHRQQAMNQKRQDFIDKIQSVPGVEEITEAEIESEIESGRKALFPYLPKFRDRSFNFLN